jgi:hypothetical protein
MSHNYSFVLRFKVGKEVLESSKDDTETK